ncbi:MAG: nucleotide exchange factor GrpE [bacterium]
MSSKKPVEPDMQPEEVLISEPQEPDYQDLWQRAVAEQQNAQKRFETEKQNQARYSKQGLIDSLLPVVDNFYRATEHVPTELEGSPWVAGILYIQKNLLDVLEGEGVAEISAKAGDQFDPHLHEAIGVVHEPAQPDDVITEIKNKGYKLHDRILRPVQVIVNHHSTN